MPERELRLPLQEQTPDMDSLGAPDRRGFLGGFGALGITAMAGLFIPASASAQLQSASNTPLKLSNPGKANVLRDESFDVPGGKEYIVQYTVSDEKGQTLRHSYNMSKTDSKDGYTLTSNFRVEEFTAGQSLHQQPSNTIAWQITAYGVKGDVIGDRRHDTVTTTMVANDGRVQRHTQVVPVRLDLSEFANLDTAALAAKMHNIHLGKEQLSK